MFLSFKFEHIFFHFLYFCFFDIFTAMLFHIALWSRFVSSRLLDNKFHIFCLFPHFRMHGYFNCVQMEMKILSETYNHRKWIFHTLFKIAFTVTNRHDTVWRVSLAIREILQDFIWEFSIIIHNCLFIRYICVFQCKKEYSCNRLVSFRF